ncbi:MAG TPA: glutathione S-transferase family protein [Caulobacteraceae bacterium]|jgi:glutathione S-transferase|nr:glutathione S-transferase family protein [Caulobacteraceae bacterium]
MTATITTFRWVPPFAAGFVRDHRLRWACEEANLAYDLELIGFDDRETPTYRARQPFGQVPVWGDDAGSLFETGAILLRLARGRETLAPQDEAGFDEVTAWVIAGLNSVEPHVQNFAGLDTFHGGAPWVEGYRPVAEGLLRGRLAALGTWLTGRDHLLGRFTVADIIMSTVLRELEGSGVMADYPAVEAYWRRCEARPGWKRALEAQLATFRKNAPPSANG